MNTKKRGGKYKSWDDLSLWPHQLNALRMVRKYLESKSKASALVRMPTGTGKSGVIAISSRCFDDMPNVLVVTPWIVLRRQLTEDIRERFWKKIDTNPRQWKKTIRQIRPSNVQEILEKTRGKNIILVSTIATLQIIHSKLRSDYELLKGRISLVIVDEGHREPAPEWAKAVRELKKKTILFTATPYRNDYKMFNVDPEHVFAYSHRKAVQERYIREVQFHEEDFGNSPGRFTDALLTFFDVKLKKLKPSDVKLPRVIVRCETDNDVNDIASRLRSAGRKVIGIHERFSDDEEDFRHRRVPDPDTNDAEFWVHQNKLIEGIDDPRFLLLAIYQPLRNARALVQQIGRIVRNPGREKWAKAHVFTCRGHRQRLFWKGYRKYEEHYEADPDRYEARQLFDTISQLQPEYQYFDRNYRQRFNIESKALHRQFRYRLSANVYIVGEKFRLDKLADEVKTEWYKNDLDIRRTERPDDRTRVHTYVNYGNSEVLLRHSLFEYKIGFTIYRRVGKYVFFYDSQGNSLEYLTKTAKRPDPKLLESLFSGTNTRLSEISLMNSDFGRHSIRRRTLHAYSIGETAPGLVDHAHFCSTAQGYTNLGQNGFKRRYIGFTRARITDPSSLPHEYDDYIKWLDSLANTLEINWQESLPLFDRFANYTSPPSDPTPANILLDIEDVLNSFETSGFEADGKRRPLFLEDLCCRCIDGKFTCIANSQKYSVNICYIPDKKIYKLTSKELEKAYIRRDPGSGKIRSNLIAYLNRFQSFRVVPKTPGYIYAHSHFYKPRLSLGGRVRKDRFDLLKILYPIQELAAIGDEKGNGKSNGSGWESGSLFSLVDALGKGTQIEPEMQGIDILVCDDMGTEVADFIAADSNKKRVILMHAKVSKRAAIRSASAFHVVCSQSTKNLDYIHPYCQSKPPNLKRWNYPWRTKYQGIVNQRIRRGTKKASSIWEKICEILRDPSASREVWFLLGQSFSLSEFEEERNKANPVPEIVQILYLLQSTWGAVSSVGATLKIFCSP